MALTFTDENFEEEVLKSDVPVLVDFYADWCGPCKMMTPIIDELYEDFDGKIKVGKVNTDENTDITAQYEVMSIPTLVLIKNGEEVDRIIGVRPKSELEEKMESLL